MKLKMFKCIMIALVLSISNYIKAQHYSQLLVFNNKEFIEEQQVNMHVKLKSNKLIINYNKTLYKYDVKIDTVRGTMVVAPFNNNFSCITDTTKEVFAIIKYENEILIELIYSNYEE